jgi:hypothetical protein
VSAQRRRERASGLPTSALQAYVARGLRPAATPPADEPPPPAADPLAAWRAAAPGAWPCPPRALGATWDPLLARRLGARAGEQARRAGSSGVRGPGLALAEDPLLAGTLAAAWAIGARSAGVEPLFALPPAPDPAQRHMALCLAGVGATVVQLDREPPSSAVPLDDDALTADLAGASAVLVADPLGLVPCPSGVRFDVHGPGAAALVQALPPADAAGDVIAVALPGLPTPRLHELLRASEAVIVVLGGTQGLELPAPAATIIQAWSADPLTLASLLCGSRMPTGRLAAALTTSGRTFPFGHGLGAARLVCRRVHVQGEPAAPTAVELLLRNPTSRATLEVVQVYLRGPRGTRLGGFARVTVDARTTAAPTILLDPRVRDDGPTEELVVGVGAGEPWVSLRLGR